MVKSLVECGSLKKSQCANGVVKKEQQFMESTMHAMSNRGLGADRETVVELLATGVLFVRLRREKRRYER